MVINQEQVIEALNLIKTICCSYTCDECPFRNNDKCQFQNVPPYHWNIKEVDKFRAFE